MAWVSKRFHLRALLVGQLVTIILVCGIAWWPKTEVLPCCAEYVGWYRGFGYAGLRGILGKEFFKVVLPPTDHSDGTTRVYLTGEEGYVSFRGYSYGTLREEGVCYVTYDSIYPMPDIHKVWNAVYYTPSGEIGSRVVNGTGRQTYWNANGLVVWELELKEGKREAVHVHLSSQER